MRRLLILATTLALAACGGGGSGSGSNAVVPPISIPSTQPASHAIKLRAGFNATGAATASQGRQVLSSRSPLALGITGSLVPLVGYAVFPSWGTPLAWQENVSAYAYLADTTNDLPATGPAATWTNSGVPLTMTPFSNWTSPGPVQQPDGSWSEMLTTPQTINLVPGSTQTGSGTLTATTSVSGQTYSTNIAVNVYNGMQLNLTGNGVTMVKFVNGLATPQPTNNTADVLLEQNQNGITYLVCQYGCALVNGNFLTLTTLPSIPVGSASVDGLTIYNDQMKGLNVLVIRDGDGTYTKWFLAQLSSQGANASGVNNGDINILAGQYRQCSAAGVCDI